MVLIFTEEKEATFKDGCLSLRKSVLDKMKAKNAPGPIYNPKARVSSTEKTTFRDITFGTGPARYNDKPEHTKRRVPNTCHHPGPQTYDPELIRKAIHMKQRNIAGMKFGTGKRDVTSPCDFPSPAEYDPEMIRRGIMFSKSGSTHVKFGTARNQDSKPCGKPGPATYNPEAIRRGLMFTKSKMPSVKFGDPPKKDESERKNSSKNNQPGPQEYDTERLRRAVYSLSTKKRPTGVKFGPRTYNDVEERERVSKPGPSAYDIPSAFGRQSNSRYRSQPCISFGAR